MMKKYPKTKYPDDPESNGVFAEGEIVIQEKMDGCLPYNQRVQTENGSIPIGKIVNNEMDVKVKSLDSNGNIVYERITNYYKNGSSDRWLSVDFDGKRSSCVKLTPNHEVYTVSGTKQAGDLSPGDKLISDKPELTDGAKEMLVGSLLGDASMGNPNKYKNCHIEETHGENQHKYSEFKMRILGELISNSYTEFSAFSEECPEKEKLKYTTVANRSINGLCEKFISDNGEKKIPESIEITDRILAILYGDDGSCSFSEHQRPRATIHTNGFTKEEVKRLFESIGIEGRVAEYGYGPMVEFSSDGTEELFSRVSKWLPECMSYKVSDEYWNDECLWEVQDYDRQTFEITSVEEFTPHNKTKYDIEVENTHRYYTKNILVSNSNFRFCLDSNLDEEYQEDGRNLVFGSRNVAYKNSKDETNQFAETMGYLRRTVDIDAVEQVQDVFGPLTFFGESMENPHTIKEYDFGEIPLFIGFDIWQHDEGRFLPRGEMEHVYDQLGIETVPVVDIVQAEAWGDYEFGVPESEYGDVKAEGVVFKNHTTETYAKFVREDFKERKNKSFGKPKKQQESGAEKLSYQYVTDSRIEKTAHKLLDEGDYDRFQMEMMQDLPVAVIEDMAEEEAKRIFTEERWEIDIAEFRSITASRCAQVLKRMLARRRKESI
jgi:hypothetical protein